MFCSLGEVKITPNYNNRGGLKSPRDKNVTGIRDFTTTPLPIPKIFLVVYLLKLSSECLVSYDPHFPGNDGTNKKGGGKGLTTRHVFGPYINIRIFFSGITQRPVLQEKGPPQARVL